MAMTPLTSLDRTAPDFRPRVDTFFATDLPRFVTEANALEANVDAKAAATTTAVDAAMAAGLANAAANAAQTTSDRIQTGEDRSATGQDRTQTGLDRAAVAAALGSIADGPVASVGGATGVVVLKTLNGQALVGAGNIVIESSIIRDARTANAAIVAADKLKLIDITAGTFTQTFAAAATLGNGWYAYLRNSGTGDITLDPNSAETIDGLAGYVMYPGECRLILCDGTALRTIVLNSFNRTFTASGTFAKPPGYLAFDGFMWGGGQSGGPGGGTLGAAGGKGADRISFLVFAASVSSTETVTIGAGGVGPAGTVSTPGAPVAGGATSFGALVSTLSAETYQGIAAPGGIGGVAVTGSQPGNIGGASNSGGGGGGSGGSNGSGGVVRAGGAAGASTLAGAGAPGGASGLGNGDATTGPGGNGQNGAVPGGGGGGGGGAGFNTSMNGGKGGNGGRGELRIWGVI